MDIINYFHEEQAISFLLLFIRISFLLAFLPLFNNMAVPMVYKATFALYLSLIFYFEVEPPHLNSWLSIGMAILSEMVFSMFVGLTLSITLYLLMLAGEHISLIMGFSMATVFDYQSGISMPMISQFLNMLALLTLLSFDGHHLMLVFIHNSLNSLPLGGFVLSDNQVQYLIKAFKNMFVMGLSISFPIVALSLLSDIMFGMLMKTMPQFNLLVIGYPIKIGMGFVVLIAVLSGMMLVFKREYFLAFQHLETLIR